MVGMTIIQSPPQWARQKTVLALFEIGRIKLEDFRKKGVVLTHVEGNNVLYRIKDIDEALEAEASGRTPKIKRK